MDTFLDVSGIVKRAKQALNFKKDVKIRYSHINRESVLPLGKDMVQIPPISPRFIDTIFSIGYIVGVISKKELTAMPSHPLKTRP